MKQKVTLAVTGIAFGLAIAACNSSTAPTPSPSTTPSPASSGNPVASPTLAGIAPCNSSQLSIKSGETGAAAGNEWTAIVLTNTSSQACTLIGYPTVSYLDSTHNPVAGVAEDQNGGMFYDNPAPTVVKIAPGADACFGVSYGEGGANPSSATSTQVILPGVSGTLSINRAVGPSTANPGQTFEVAVTSIQPGDLPHSQVRK